ncbi:hypothetical protein P1O93_004542 [Escherichia coli]|nr:hypothetical protein [Escherichia coli]ELQ6892524.1 hypothetical protein [Escherichia coli]
MCNNTRPDAAAEAIKTLIDALIDISVIADIAGFSEMLTKSGVSADQLRGGDYAK